MAIAKESKTSRYVFDDLKVDPENFRIHKGDEARTLKPRAFDMLI